MVVVEGDPAPNADLGLRPGFPGVQVDEFILQGPPEAFDEDVVEAAPLRGVIRPHSSVCTTADTARGEERLSSGQNQAILLSSDRPLGE
jgi:hypothetical protein